VNLELKLKNPSDLYMELHSTISRAANKELPYC
jgi:hypothetical protein